MFYIYIYNIYFEMVVDDILQKLSSIIVDVYEI